MDGDTFFNQPQFVFVSLKGTFNPECEIGCFHTQDGARRRLVELSMPACSRPDFVQKCL